MMLKAYQQNSLMFLGVGYVSTYVCLQGLHSDYSFNQTAVSHYQALQSQSLDFSFDYEIPQGPLP